MEDSETPVGIAGRLRPRRSDSDEEAQLKPHGKGATWSCNQLSHSKIATIYSKTTLLKGLLNHVLQSQKSWLKRFI